VKYEQVINKKMLITEWLDPTTTETCRRSSETACSM